jgi:Ca-activated chloride channel family protein
MITTSSSRKRCPAVLSLVIVVAAFRADVFLQTPSPAMPQVRILSPHEDAFVSGPTRLRAGVEPPDAVSSVVFSVDGRQVCSATKPPFECEWDAGATIAEHQVRLAVYLTTGGRVVQITRTKGIGFAETVDVDVVQVTVTVRDDRGHHVNGLPKSAFHVAEDGRPQAISHFYSEDVPLDLVVAVDISESMTQAMPTARKAVSTFLGAVPSRDRVTLLGFNDEVFTLTRKTTDPAERMRAVDGLAAWGSTVLYDVIVQGAEMLGPQTGRKALVVFTDGDDRGSHVTLAEVEQRLQASDVTLYMIGQGRGVTSEPLKRLMDRLSRPTGGRAFFTDSINELEDAFTELLEELSNQYVLGYQSTNSARDHAWRDIKVDVDGHRRIRARQGYRIQNSEFGIRN